MLLSERVGVVGGYGGRVSEQTESGPGDVHCVSELRMFVTVYGRRGLRSGCLQAHRPRVPAQQALTGRRGHPICRHERIARMLGVHAQARPHTIVEHYIILVLLGCVRHPPVGLGRIRLEVRCVPERAQVESFIVEL